MIPIKKGKPPRDLVKEVVDYKDKVGSSPSWEHDIHCKPEVTASLVREQGGLCAYCMSRVEVCHGSVNDAHVEHILPQSKCEHGEDVDYGNMLAVCEGQRGKTSWCDRSKGDKPLAVNPLKPQTLRLIRYRADGLILSDDDDIERDLNVTLNLNGEGTGLKENRKAVVEQLYRELNRVGNRGGDRAVRKYCRERLDVLSKPDSDGFYTPYVGVLRYFLEKRLKR